MASVTDRLIDMVDAIRGKLRSSSSSDGEDHSKWRGPVAVGVVAFVVLNLILGWYWSREPEQPLYDQTSRSAVVGQATTSALIAVVNTLLNKPGGYLSNDVTPPSLFMDNMKNWEFGVLVQARELGRVLRNDFSRSQSQSVENAHLAEADPLLSSPNNSWIFPSTEGKLQEAVAEFEKYRRQLVDVDQGDAQFYARADNMASWLAVIEKRLGSLSQRLSASIGQMRINTDLAGDPDAQQATPNSNDVEVKTSWTEIDDVFYETRGTAWALIQFLKAAEYDFRDVLIKKNALISLRQIIRELEATQISLGSPVILNGSGFGVFANHSLVMASYISRANSAVINLRELLADG